MEDHHSIHALIVALYAAFNQRDIDQAVALMNAEVDWPNGMEGGRVRGRDEVRAYWTRQWLRLNPRVEPVRMRDDGLGNTIVDVHQIIRDTAGNLLKDQFVRHVYSFRDGLVERMDIHAA